MAACAGTSCPLNATREWACSSVVEHCVDIAGVASSILATPTIFSWKFSKLPDLQPSVLILGLEDPVDLHHQVLEVQRLGQKLGLRRRSASLQCHRGKSGNEHHPDCGVDRARLLGQL